MLIQRFAFLGFIVIAGCNPHNTQDACYDVGRAYCQRIFDLSAQGCASASSYLADQSYASLNDCLSGFTFIHGDKCASISTSACSPEDFSGSRAATCASDVGKLQCDWDWSAGPLSSTPECGNICCRHSGNFGSGIECCSGSSHLEQSTGCSFEAPQSVCD